jgi:hypothetical protein
LHSRLSIIATRARGFLEPIWQEWHREDGLNPLMPSMGVCGRSSLFLTRVLQCDFGFEAQWRSGTAGQSQDDTEIGQFGFFTGQRWESHAWTECDNWIVDITADQFEAPGVLVASKSDQRYRASAQDTAHPFYRMRRVNAVEAIWPRWLQSLHRDGLSVVQNPLPPLPRLR